MGEKILEMKNITVDFPGVRALNLVDIQAYTGEVHVIIGENGAGKSTIMKVLAGINSNYEGTVIFKGEEIDCNNIQRQRDLGISMIFQELNLLENLTVAENIYMGRHPQKRTGNVDWAVMERDAEIWLQRIGSNIPAKTVVRELTVGQKQMVEIAKAVSINSEIIIMDEPTSALTEKEIDKLFEMINKLKADGVAIFYISHRMQEIMEIGDRVTILRDGVKVKEMMISDTEVNEIVNYMVGRELTDFYPKEEPVAGNVSLKVDNITQGNRLINISFQARKGEITCFYGLMGAGRTELMRVIFGADPYDSGTIYVNGQEVKIHSCEDAKRYGIALLTEDRKNQGLILEFSINHNISLPRIEKVMNLFGINYKYENENNEKLSQILKIKTPSLEQKVKNLSGGNQQKVVIAKWLNADPDIFIFDEPTRGIDVGAKTEIYRIMNELKRKGKTVIMVSSELAECIGISDCIYVMHEGEITGCISEKEIEEVTEKKIMALATATAKQ